MSGGAMTPREIVSELDRHIVGQQEAKRAVAIALRNRWRRQQVEPGLRHEITPKNILMIGPTGVGKTEIARRLARLADAPFIKVEATKFTEVGYVGKDVDTIIRDLAEIAVKNARESEKLRQRPRAEDAAEERLLDALVPPPSGGAPAAASGTASSAAAARRRRTGRRDSSTGWHCRPRGAGSAHRNGRLQPPCSCRRPARPLSTMPRHPQLQPPRR